MGQSSHGDRQPLGLDGGEELIRGPIHTYLLQYVQLRESSRAEVPPLLIYYSPLVQRRYKKRNLLQQLGPMSFLRDP